MRKDGALNYIIGDHLGSTSIVTDANGTVVSEMRYKAWGEVRHESGATPTKYQYTGQYSHQSDFGLLFYNARWLDPYLNRFIQPDTFLSCLLFPPVVCGIRTAAWSSLWRSKFYRLFQIENRRVEQKRQPNTRKSAVKD